VFDVHPNEEWPNEQEVGSKRANHETGTAEDHLSVHVWFEFSLTVNLLVSWQRFHVECANDTGIARKERFLERNFIYWISFLATIPLVT
jgi:hypothetical protein